MEFRNNFTKFMDSYRIDSIMNLEEPYEAMMTTYLWYNDIESDNYEDDIKDIAFRLPGATRGHIEVDKDNIIKKIVFYDDTCFNANHNGIECYKKEIEVAVNTEFLHTKLDIVNGYKGDEYLEPYLKEVGYNE